MTVKFKICYLTYDLSFLLELLLFSRKFLDVSMVSLGSNLVGFLRESSIVFFNWLKKRPIFHRNAETSAATEATISSAYLLLSYQKMFARCRQLRSSLVRSRCWTDFVEKNTLGLRLLNHWHLRRIKSKSSDAYHIIMRGGEDGRWSWVNFTDIILAAFMRPDLKSAKKDSQVKQLYCTFGICVRKSCS